MTETTQSPGKAQLTKQEWVAMFEAVGLDDDTMSRWHQVFEQRAPEAHQAFLEWLSVAPEEIVTIRERSRG